MATRDLVFIGNPILRQKARRIHRFDSSLPQLVRDMFETMYAADGIGLAAPQIGLGVRLFVIDCADRETGQTHKVAMANPEIILAEGEQIGVDGCLSIPGYYGINVRRAARVVVKGQDMRGRPMRISAEGLFAWALQHEIDHLDGILFLDRLDRPEDLREAPSDSEEAFVECIELRRKNGILQRLCPGMGWLAHNHQGNYNGLRLRETPDFA